MTEADFNTRAVRLQPAVAQPRTYVGAAVKTPLVAVLMQCTRPAAQRTAEIKSRGTPT